MNNNYYTPSIEEFHVGFEYDFKGQTEWIPKITMDSEDLGCILLEEANDPEFDTDQFRVKYLDEEDIKELGFESKGKSVCLWYTLEKRIEDGFSDYGYWNIITLIHCDNNRVKIFAQEYKGDDEHVLFQGEIKNKSELKRVMNQIGIF